MPAPSASPGKRSPSPFPVTAANDFGQTRVLKWKDGKRAVFMVEFDDSAPSHLEFAIPALKNRGLPGTFYINPGNGPYKSHQAAWEREANSPGIELANHTFSHIGAPSLEEFDREIAEANDVIDRLYPHRPASRLRDWARPGVPREQWKISEAEIQTVLAKYHMSERPQAACARAYLLLGIQRTAACSDGYRQTLLCDAARGRRWPCRWRK